MRNIRCRKVRCKSNPFDICAKRRREIVFHARLVGAADTEDFSRWLIAWIWHNPKATDQIWAVMEAAKRMGGKITEAEASDLTEEASITRKRLFETRERILADEMARFLGVTYDQRRKLGITAIGSIDVNKAGRKEIRRVRDKVKRRQKRRAAGVRPRAEYEAHSLSKLKPWAAEGISRSTWERRRHRNMTRTQNDASVSAAIFLKAKDGLASARTAEGSSTLKEASKGLPSSQTVTMMAVDVHQSLPVELRLLALNLPLPDEMKMAA